MKRLIIDMDDVIADATGQFIQFYEKEFGVRVTRDSLNHKDEGLGFPAHHHEVIQQFPFRETFFQTMIPHEGSQEALEKLNKKYELFIVSAAMQFPQSLIEKFKWLAEYFPFLHWKQIVFCGSKAVVHGDYMIDDLAYNLETFNGEKFIFTAPHNLHIDKYRRLNSWKEAEEIFL
ncbi:5'(3')-deoxyribonucleotidase [Chryseolinea sp. H1M3-3]|uniref:5' nucleotidase, NT5C type n=1 Tax=Chryseolinea sp. H1M3-3 TaxID=3034144 RepID=UPI0023EC3DDE|nr:5'(3')-deoxyribonucleotidase [Chryseolinea sp. H1M3-3]